MSLMSDGTGYQEFLSGYHGLMNEQSLTTISASAVLISSMEMIRSPKSTTPGFGYSVASDYVVQDETVEDDRKESRRYLHSIV